jgi:hypothetical protein
MPRAEGSAGDTRRDPRTLLAAAALLLVLRAGVTVWEERHPPASPDGVGSLAPQATPRMIFSGSTVRGTRPR